MNSILHFSQIKTSLSFYYFCYIHTVQINASNGLSGENLVGFPLMKLSSIKRDVNFRFYFSTRLLQANRWAIKIAEKLKMKWKRIGKSIMNQHKLYNLGVLWNLKTKFGCSQFNRNFRLDLFPSRSIFFLFPSTESQMWRQVQD